MEIKQFNEIPIYDWGNKYVLSGMLFTNNEEESFIVMLPQKLQELSNNLKVIAPSIEEWKQLLNQTDLLEVEGRLEDNQKIVLRKGTRNVDSKISWKVFKRDKFKCRYCGISHVPLTVDHIITWETGGPTIEENLLTSCRKCNRTRGNMSYREWLNTGYYRSKHQYLTPEVIQKNYEIVNTLNTIELVPIIRNR
jgi:hypothetical protein